MPHSKAPFRRKLTHPRLVFGIKTTLQAMTKGKKETTLRRELRKVLTQASQDQQ